MHKHEADEHEKSIHKGKHPQHEEPVNTNDSLPGDDDGGDNQDRPGGPPTRPGGH